MTDVCDLPATEQSALLRSGELSARELLDASLQRIGEVNPQVNALVTLDVEAATAAATAADEAYAAGEPLGPLHGLPLAVKDTHDTAGMRTTYGSPLFAENVPEADELVVARMRDAGAVIVGKSNTPEFAAGSHTFNPVFGLTRNPYDPTRSAGGSSGGAATALATGMVALADGSDMGGSLRNPASFCNVVGHRPSPGRVPNVGPGDPWFTLSVQGPMGRTVADVALLLSAQAGPDPRSPIALPEPGTTFATALPTRLDGWRIAVAPDFAGAVPVDAEVAAAVEAQAGTLTELGAVAELAAPDLTGAEEVFRTLRALHFVAAFGELVDRHPDQVKEAIRWNVEAGRALTGTDVARATTLRGALYRRVREFFTRYDALVVPPSQVLPFDAALEYPTSVAGTPVTDYLGWMLAPSLISATECPATAVPVGFSTGGLPIGVQVVAGHRDDLGALGVAHALEAANRPRVTQRPPAVRTSIVRNRSTA
ncbi:amidase [Pseudonocardia phyllosphaerae]|uniref:amidase n=1 Tax=Pseudonocardia phyllosphaerae TaxID=3390502 RepID=UPI0039784CBF